MSRIVRYIYLLTLVSFLFACGGNDNQNSESERSSNIDSNGGGEQPYSYWSETAVRKILHTFAYGGQATDTQIRSWANMEPRAAIQQMLTFEENNPLLSPPDNLALLQGGTLSYLQEYWGGFLESNPTRSERRYIYATLYEDQLTQEKYLSPVTLQHTWTASINRRGLNPFRQKVGLFLTNYHMAVSVHKVRPTMIRSMYDDIMEALEAGIPFHEVLAIGATSAAVAMQYGHQYNRYNNLSSRFYGNDDFAREFHQLFFRILGEDYSLDYHENTTIEHTAWALTGMGIDRDPLAWGGSARPFDYWTDIIDFTDHVDAEGRTLNNFTNHHVNSVEILGADIRGNTAKEKIEALAQVAINERESLDSMPVFIINFFADDNLNDEKIAEIRTLWRSIEPKNLLTFLQEYAISPTFHREDTFKYRTAFSRNLALFNLNTVDDEEAYHNSWTPLWTINEQGALPFSPAHDVFGGQTSINAANNPDIFKSAYNTAVDNPWSVIKYFESYPAGSADTWEKDWARVIPANNFGKYRVKEVGEWLWQRFVADGLKNYGPIERAYVTAFLATGNDFGMIVDPDNPDASFTPEQLASEPYRSIIDANEAATIDLKNSETIPHRIANRYVGMAINFISMTPFMFAMEGR
ncbi:MAG: DUF1800 domain-containing protein [Gammaproteobacteria bacterium]|nr:DUF1800 domain-containing protein [Gammaproteobacteria bacterium]MDH5778006.1 DUF1800 domain-containing protein [Gammaproteobacteria bacterium]